MELHWEGSAINGATMSSIEKKQLNKEYNSMKSIVKGI